MKLPLLICFALAPAGAFAQTPALIRPSAGGDVMKVGGHALAVFTVEPVEDGVFAVRSSALLAAKYRAFLLDMADLPDNQQAPQTVQLPDALPRRLVRVHKASDGHLFLYAPCDPQNHARERIHNGTWFSLGGEALALPIRGVTTRRGAFRVRLDTENQPPFVASVFELRPTPHVPGLFVLHVPGAAPEWRMPPEEAAKLDLVVNRCRSGKVHEFSFNPPPPAPPTRK